MPGPYENLFYSIDIGPIHLLSLTTEVYYNNYADLLRQEKLQYDFMENDLKVIVLWYKCSRLYW